jgi:hypothetical protein
MGTKGRTLGRRKNVPSLAGPLTRRQRAFLSGKIVGLSDKQAALDAGYSLELPTVCEQARY